MTLKEARRIIKDEIKRQGKVVGHYRVSDITKAARELIASENNPKPEQSRKGEGK